MTTRLASLAASELSVPEVTASMLPLAVLPVIFAAQPTRRSSRKLSTFRISPPGLSVEGEAIKIPSKSICTLVSVRRNTT